MSQSLCDHVTKRFVSERAGGGVCHPESKSKLCLFAFKSGSPEQTKIYLFAMGKAEVRVAFNFPHRVPKINGCFILGKRRYELLSMIEQSDIIRATSLPNATSSVFTTLLSNATSELQRISICHSRDIVCDEHKLLVCVTWSRVSFFACFVPVVF